MQDRNRHCCSAVEPPDALEARRRNAVRRRPKMRPKRGGRRRKIWKTSKDVWKPCNPLKSNKTAKDLFGKAWSETREFWRSLEKGLEGAFIPPPLAPSHQRPPIHERIRLGPHAFIGARFLSPGLQRK